jgi:hypothetical protein
MDTLETYHPTPLPPAPPQPERSEQVEESPPPPAPRGLCLAAVGERMVGEVGEGVPARVGPCVACGERV